jgi:hypothetical protein
MALTNPPPVGTVLDAAAVLRLQSPKTALNPVLGFHKRRMVDLTGIVPAGGAAGAAACLSTVRANQRPSVATELVDQNSASWNQTTQWLRQIAELRAVSGL